MWSSVSRSVSSETARSSPWRSVRPTAPTGTLNCSSTTSASPKVNWELPPPVSKTTRGPRRQAEPRRGREVGEAALLLAGDDLDPDAAGGLDGADERGGVRRRAQPRGADGRDRGRAGPARLLGQRRDRLPRAVHRLRLEGAGRVEAFAEAGHDRAVDDVAPRVVGASLADVELDRVRADVDHGVAHRPEAEQRLQPAHHAHVRARGEAEGATGARHQRRIRGLEHERARGAVVRAELADLGHAPADDVVGAPLVRHDGPQRVDRPHDLVEELLGGVGLAVERRARDHVQPGERGADALARHRERVLGDRDPLLEPIVVDGQQALHVELAVAELHRRIAVAEEQVQVGALFEALDLEGAERLLSRAEVVPERPPFPSWDDLHRHRNLLRGLDVEPTAREPGETMAAPDTVADAAAPPPYAQESADVVAGLGSDAASGLTAGEAAERLSRYGPNAIEGEKPPSVWAVALQQLRDPMNIMLVAVTVVSFIIGEVSTGVDRGAADPPQRGARLEAGAAARARASTRWRTCRSRRPRSCATARSRSCRPWRSCPAT